MTTPGTGDGNGAPADQGDQGSNAGHSTKGYTPPASQEDLDRIIDKAVGKYHAKYADYDQIKTQHGEYKTRLDQLEFDLATDSERAATKAREEARDEVLKEATPRLVRAEFKAAAKGLLSDDQTKSLLEFLDEVDLSKYVDAKGEVDEDKIAKRIATFAPAKGSSNGGRHVDLGQGGRPAAGAQPGDQARNQLAKRFGATQGAK